MCRYWLNFFVVLMLLSRCHCSNQSMRMNACGCGRVSQLTSINRNSHTSYINLNFGVTHYAFIWCFHTFVESDNAEEPERKRTHMHHRKWMSERTRLLYLRNGEIRWWWCWQGDQNAESVFKARIWRNTQHMYLSILLMLQWCGVQRIANKNKTIHCHMQRRILASEARSSKKKTTTTNQTKPK